MSEMHPYTKGCLPDEFQKPAANNEGVRASQKRFKESFKTESIGQLDCKMIRRCMHLNTLTELKHIVKNYHTLNWKWDTMYMALFTLDGYFQYEKPQLRSWILL